MIKQNECRENDDIKKLDLVNALIKSGAPINLQDSVVVDGVGELKNSKPFSMPLLQQSLLDSEAFQEAIRAHILSVDSVVVDGVGELGLINSANIKKVRTEVGIDGSNNSNTPN